MERLKTMKSQLMSAVEGQMGNLQCVDYEELGAAIDMIKDLEEAIYYCTVVEAMEKKDEEEPKYYRSSYPMYYDNRDMDRLDQKMYYSEPSAAMTTSARGMGQGKSGQQRKMYMESKAMHKDSLTSMRELEKYMNELSADLTEMIAEATPEEKQLLQKKLTTLAGKIV